MAILNNLSKMKNGRKPATIIAVLFLLLLFAFLIDIANIYWIVSFIINPSSNVIHQHLLRSRKSSFKRLSSIIKTSSPMSKSKHWSEVRGNSVVLLAKIDNTRSIEKIANAIKYDQQETVCQYYIPAFLIIGKSGIPALIGNLRGNSVNARRSSIIVLSIFENDIALNAIIESLLNDPSSEVRSSAADVLRAHKSRKTVLALIEALNDKDSKVADSSYYSLIILKDDIARKPIWDYYQKRCWLRYTKHVGHFEIFRFCLKNGNENMKNDALKWLRNKNLGEEDIKDKRKRNPIYGKDYVF